MTTNAVQKVDLLIQRLEAAHGKVSSLCAKADAVISSAETYDPFSVARVRAYRYTLRDIALRLNERLTMVRMFANEVEVSKVPGASVPDRFIRDEFAVLDKLNVTIAEISGEIGSLI